MHASLLECPSISTLSVERQGRGNDNLLISLPSRQYRETQTYGHTRISILITLLGVHVFLEGKTRLLGRSQSAR
jgi:hypothetical protein